MLGNTKRIVCVELWFGLFLAPYFLGSTNGRVLEKKAGKCKNQLTEVPFNQGSYVEFCEPRKGMVVVHARGKNAPDINDGSDPEEVYEKITGGSKPPKKLKEANDKLKKNKDAKKDYKNDPPADQEEVPVDDLEDQGNRKLQTIGTGSWFQNLYCRFSFVRDFCRCWTYITGGPYWYSRVVDDMGASLYPYRGSVTNVLKYWSCNGCSMWCWWWSNDEWCEFYKDEVPQGDPDSHRIFHYPITWLRAEVRDGYTNGYHWEAHSLDESLGQSCSGEPCYCRNEG